MIVILMYYSALSLANMTCFSVSLIVLFALISLTPQLQLNSIPSVNSLALQYLISIRQNNPAQLVELENIYRP